VFREKGVEGGKRDQVEKLLDTKFESEKMSQCLKKHDESGRGIKNRGGEACERDEQRERAQKK